MILLALPLTNASPFPSPTLPLSIHLHDLVDMTLQKRLGNPIPHTAPLRPSYILTSVPIDLRLHFASRGCKVAIVNRGKSEGKRSRSATSKEL